MALDFANNNIESPPPLPVFDLQDDLLNVLSKMTSKVNMKVEVKKMMILRLKVMEVEVEDSAPCPLHLKIEAFPPKPARARTPSQRSHPSCCEMRLNLKWSRHNISFFASILSIKSRRLFRGCIM
jgi:hypothetical protein